ncbi:MAG: leucine-rich repeat protein [Clostridia bacterium]|nr:leucine-rich repeat protein [Clostridia bacterium]
MKKIKLLLGLACILAVASILTFCGAISDEDVFAMERKENSLILKNESTTVTYDLGRVKRLIYSQSGNGKDAFVCEDVALMESLFSAMFADPITMERMNGSDSLTSYPSLMLEREVAFSFLMEDGTTLQWIIGLDGTLGLVAGDTVYLSAARSIDYSAISPHLTWFIITHRDAAGNRYDVSADGKTFLYYYPDNPATAFTVPEGIETVAESSFRDVKNLKEITFSSTVKTIEGYFFHNAYYEKVVIPETVQSVKYDFYNCPNLKELICAAPMTLLSGVVELPSLETLVLPATLTEIGSYAFDGGVRSLKEIRTYGQEPVKDPAFEAFCGDTVYYLPEGITELSFDRLIGLGGCLYLPDSCKTFDAVPVDYLGDAVYTISVSADTEILSGDYYDGNIRIWRRGTENEAGRVTLEDIQGNRYDLSSDGRTFLRYHSENTGHVFIVPAKVEGVRSGAFDGILCLKELSFASTVQGIGDIFYPNIPLERLTLPASLYQYKNATFEIHTSSLKELIIRCEVGRINVNNCKSLETLWLANLPDGFGTSVFGLQRCNCLKCIYVDGQSQTRDQEFEELCASVNEYPILYLPEGVEGLGEGVIASQVNLYVPDSVTWVSYEAFANGCEDVVVSLPAHASIIGSTGEDVILSAGTVVRRGTTDPARIQQIERAWLETYGYALKWFDISAIQTRHYGLRDYGTYDGYTILFMPKPLVIEGGSTLRLNAETVFAYGTEFELLAYRAGVFYPVEALYEQGKLSGESLALVAKIHASMEAMLDAHPFLDDPHSYPGLVKWIGDYSDFRAEVRPIHPEEGAIYLGTYSACSVYSKGSRLRRGTCHIIGGVAFYLDATSFTAYEMYGECGEYTLEEAFNRGLVTYEELRSIAAQHYSSYLPVFPDVLDLPPLSESVINDITRAWASWSGNDSAKWFSVDDLSTRHFGIRYYGKYPSKDPGVGNDYIILYIPETRVNRTRYYGEFYAYWQGGFYRLDSLCDRGRLDESVKDAVTASHELLEAWILEQENLDDPRWYGGQSLPALAGWPSELGIQQPRERYCGTFNGCITYLGNFDPKLRTDEYVTVGGVEFLVGMQAVYVYKDGEEMYLWDAFNCGLLNAEELRAIAYYCYGDTLD